MPKQVRTAEEILEEKSLRILRKIRRAREDQSQNYKRGIGPSISLHNEINCLCHQWEKLFMNYGVLPIQHPLNAAECLTEEQLHSSRKRYKTNKK